ncbi:MAG TPA: hypothetical protein VNW99_08200, partial [Cytophagaceae bacterium]|nr:hypothetical protein [Cytophagaceae bacterium]
RQGDPGSSQFFVSLEDNLMRLFGSDRIASLMDKMGLKEGEVIQHSMISKSIERAQKKVEENNFSTRKRLLEYDDVMNSQRELIYKRRRNALFGERLELDIMNTIYDTCESMIINTQAAGNYDNFLLQVMSTLGITTSITEKEFSEGKIEMLANRLYNEAQDFYTKKTKILVEKTLPVFRDIHKNKGATVETIVIPFTDGKKQINVVANLKALLEPSRGELRTSIEKFSSLMLIDQAWKEHLREMDDLKQAVHHAYLEQKDPLLVYKFEGFNMFKAFVSKMNEDTISFLFKADLPVNDEDDVHEAKEVKQKRNYKEKKEEASSVLSGGGPRIENNRPAEERIMPAKSEKVANRNDRVSVKYSDGSVKKDVKYKTIEEDLKKNKCVIIE